MAEAMAWDGDFLPASRTETNRPVARPMTFRTSQKNLSPILRKARTLLKGYGGHGGVQGNIDAIDADAVSGWVKKRELNLPLAIDLLVNGQPVRQAYTANLLRIDLREAGLGDGRFGFDLAGLDLKPGPGERTEVEIRLAGSGEPLLRRVVDLGSVPPQDVRSRQRRRTYEMQVDEIAAGFLGGWAVDRESPGTLFDLEVRIDGTFFGLTRNDHPRSDLKEAGKSNGLGGIRLKLPLDRLEEGPHEVSVTLPNGQSFAQVVVTEQQAARSISRFGDASVERTAVVVPVYNAPDDLRTCIERLVAHTPEAVEILFIDDASPDPRVRPLLDAAAARPNMRVLRNEQNLGFTRTVNRGIAETGTKDVLLLNSDARVTPGWVEGMLRAARSRPRVATVTAMSDRAGAFSAPEIGNENALPTGVDEIAFARAFRLHGLGLYPLVPTGNGFCMLVRRACLDEVGLLDAEAFPRGYGEENDFCMRAGRAGWRHVIDDCTYVFHDRSKSFGEAKTDLMAAGRAVVDTRYPDYKKAIGVFGTSPEINLARFRARQALRYCGERAASLPRALYVVSTQTGGTPQTNLDLMGALEDVVDGWLLRCDSRVIELSHVRRGEASILRRHELGEPVDAISHHSAEYDLVLEDWLSQLDPDLVHIRHMGWHSLSLPRIAKELGAAVVFSFHDFYTVCPTTKLLDETATFCGGQCTVPSGVDCKPELWGSDSLPTLKHAWVKVWRERFARVFEQCDAFVTTSDSARETVLRNFPSLPADRFRVIPHGRDFDEFLRLRYLPAHGRPLRILVPGNISGPKGLEVIFKLLDHDAAGLLEFHVIGKVAMRGRPPHPRLICHGTYERDEFAGMVARAEPHLGAVFSIWDETYCHTLTELWSVGLPALVFDFPTVANRVRATGGGWVLPHRDIPALYQEILRVAFDPDEQIRADAALLAWQTGAGASSTTRRMAAEYLGVYRAALDRAGGGATRPRALRVGVLDLAGQTTPQAGASTEIRLGERTHNALDRNVDYVRMAPASLMASVTTGEVDAVLLQGGAVPASLTRSLLAALRRSGVPYLLDLDDDPLDVPAEKDPTGSHAAHVPLLRELVANARALTVSTPELLAATRKLDPGAHLLPNRLSGSLWGGPVPARHDDGVIRALYMGTLTHQADLRMVYPAVEAVAAANPGFRLGLIGVSAEELPSWVERIDIPPEATSYRLFVPWLRDRMSLFDFALAPLEDTPSNALKSPLKLLDYAALGLPVLCSDTPVYRGLAGEAPGARLVRNTTDAWISELNRQVAAGPRDSAAGVPAREWVWRHHLLEPTLPDFDALVRGMIGEALRSAAE